MPIPRMITKEELKKKHQTMCDFARYLAIERGKEYATEQDELETFRNAGILFGCKPSDVARMQICLKVARMKRDTKPDTDYDTLNYLVYHRILLEQESGKKTETRRQKER